MRNSIVKTRYCIIACLVFTFLANSCQENDPPVVSILWENEKASGIIIPKKMISDIPVDSFQTLIQIHLPNTNTAILGEYSGTDNEIIFRPLIAFTHGLKYQLTIKNNLIAEIEIPALDSATAPEVVSIYPAADTLPENLLKLYILFSKPMQEGEALKHIQLIKNDTDTLSSVFLDLQPELWNKERTMLTLWLDPGRIKRDLIPNKTLGPPLYPGEHYQLLIHHDWQDATGTLLKQDYSKHFFTTLRDSISPDINAWIIKEPVAGSIEKLEIHFNEILDHVLAENTIQVKAANGDIVKGATTINDKGSIFYFTPTETWKEGIYTLEAEPRLEDLAGNNLNHLFDTDLTQKQKEQKETFRRKFEVK